MELKAESVWDYPRPPLWEPVTAKLQVWFAGQLIAETSEGIRVCETSHPPTYYFPPTSVKANTLQPVPGASLCEYKGLASYFDVAVGDKKAERAVWTYTNPTPAFKELADYLCFYAEPMDYCMVGDLQVKPQPGNFYGGWITPNLKGPFKGVAGSRLW